MTDMHTIPMKSNPRAKREPPFVSVIYSFFNERQILPALLERTRKVLRSREDISGYELVFVNDSSTDDSQDYLCEQVEAEGDILLLNTSRNFGVSECVYAGFKSAKGDAVVYLDADLQDPPEVIHKLLDVFMSDCEAEVVYTTRKKRHGEHWVKMLITKFGYRSIKSLSDIEIPLNSGDFKLLSRRIINLLLENEERLPYIRGLVSYYGFKQVQVFYDREARFDGAENTKFPVFSRRVIYNYFDSALISFSDAPLKLGLFLGFLTAGLASIYLIVVLVQKFLGLHEAGWPAIMATMLVLGGAQLIITGFIGLYIKAIFLEVKRRPNYVIKDYVKKNDSASTQAKNQVDTPPSDPRP
jgi:glycosyltransferase involved in cell wall biosynthesis